jgi:hypothetical protein
VEGWDNRACGRVEALRGLPAGGCDGCCQTRLRGSSGRHGPHHHPLDRQRVAWGGSGSHRERDVPLGGGGPRLRLRVLPRGVPRVPGHRLPPGAQLPSVRVDDPFPVATHPQGCVGVLGVLLVGRPPEGHEGREAGSPPVVGSPPSGLAHDASKPPGLEGASGWGEGLSGPCGASGPPDPGSSGRSP